MRHAAIDRCSFTDCRTSRLAGIAQGMRQAGGQDGSLVASQGQLRAVDTHLVDYCPRQRGSIVTDALEQGLCTHASRCVRQMQRVDATTPLHEPSGHNLHQLKRQPTGSTPAQADGNLTQASTRTHLDDDVRHSLTAFAQRRNRPLKHREHFTHQVGTREPAITPRCRGSEHIDHHHHQLHHDSPFPLASGRVHPESFRDVFADGKQLVQGRMEALAVAARARLRQGSCPTCTHKETRQR